MHSESWTLQHLLVVTVRTSRWKTSKTRKDTTAPRRHSRDATHERAHMLHTLLHGTRDTHRDRHLRAIKQVRQILKDSGQAIQMWSLTKLKLR